MSGEISQTDNPSKGYSSRAKANPTTKITNNVMFLVNCELKGIEIF